MCPHLGRGEKNKMLAPGIIKRGDGVYSIRIYLRTDESGKKIMKYETFYGTETQANRRKKELELALKPRLIGPKPAAMTVPDYLEKWLGYILGTVAEGTEKTYRWHVVRLVEAFQGKHMYTLSGMDVQEAASSLGGAPRTVKGIMGTFRTAMRQAVFWGIIPKDPSFGVRMPTMRGKVGKKRILTQEEIKRILAAVKGYKHYLVLRLLALTGARLGEILGLSWKNVDFVNGKIKLVDSADVNYRFLKDAVKTTSSNRIISLDSETMSLLKNHHKEKYSGWELVFSVDGKKPLHASQVRKLLKRALKKAGIEGKVQIKSLRDSAGSIMLDSGGSLADVAQFLGHSSTATTGAVYMHAVRESTCIADQIFAKTDPQKF